MNGFVVWVSKPPSRQVYGLGLKTWGASGAARLSRRRARGAIAVLASEVSEAVVEVCPSDGEIYNLTKLPLRCMYLSFKL